MTTARNRRGWSRSTATGNQLGRQLADEAGADKIRFCKMLDVDSIAAIPKLRFQEAKAQLMRKLKDKKARKAAKAKPASDFPGDRPL